MARFLTDADVDGCVGLHEMLPAIEGMLVNYGNGEATNLTRRRIATPGGYLAVMGGVIMHDGVFGVKTFTHTQNGYSFQVSLYDGDSGELLLYTQANRLGQLRTGATTAIAIKHLANPNGTRLGIIGTGNQAGDQLRAAVQVRDIAEIHAYSRNAENRQTFATRMTDDLGIPVIAAASNQDAVADCHVVIAIASAQTPVVEGEWLAPGTTVIGAGPTLRRYREVDDSTLVRANRHFVDSLEQAPLECGDISAAVDLGLVQWGQFHELRHVVAGVVPGRASADEIVYCKLMGTGLADVAAAKVVWERAKALGIGLEMDW
ncbi:MAG: ornithine cyclodeaminase family protein [Chloroflexi bacterium]|nr:ornithine cyclodeaminase family protein [Chloroflexota bacterium]MYD47514.1 ornithine cyclodeaminase family protein [Chloroflexota bacterium]